MTVKNKDFRETLSKSLKEKRPNLTDSSIKTYVSSLANLVKKMDGEHTIAFFQDNEKEILKFLASIPAKLRKGTLSALFVLTGIDAYRTEMIEDCKKVNEEYKNQTKTEKEAVNWVTVQEIRDVYDHLKEKVDEMIKNKMIHRNTYVDFLLIALLGGVLCPPRRSLDYSVMKVRNYDESIDNFLKNSTFYFNQYKTAKKYGEQMLKVPKELLPYIKKWLKFHTNDYLLFSDNDKHLSSSQITKHLNRMFGKQVSVDILRHVYTSNFYKDMPELKKMNQLAADMGHSVHTCLTQYVKKD
jgi:hypothetical protein